MSVQHVELIYQLPLDLNTAEAFVLERLALRADKITHCSYPGSSLLARETRMHQPSIIRILKRLETKGYIKGFKGNYSSHFCTIYEMSYAIPHWKEDHPSLNGHNAPKPVLKSPKPLAYDEPLARHPDETAMQYARRVDKR